MTVAIDPKALVVESRPPPPRETRLILGMPQLCLGGLSETWLLKACGDLHWSLLADLAGLDAPAFRDAAGAPVYAAFCALAEEDLRLEAFAEHDALRLMSELSQVSASRFVSRHRLCRGSEPAGWVELLSTFVRREVAGRNRSIAKTTLAHFVAPPRRLEAFVTVGLAASFRKRDGREHRGFRRAEAPVIAATTLRPCPSQDFNGAALLYCAAYQGLADRAEWELLGLSSHDAPARSRDILFHGNAEPGEALRFELRGLRCDASGLSHWLTLTSQEGDRPLADIFTSRASLAIGIDVPFSDTHSMTPKGAGATCATFSSREVDPI